MKEEKLKIITETYLEFYPLHQKKISSLFTQNSNDGYSCNRNQVRAIMILGRNGQMIPTLLGKCLGLQKGSLTTLLDSLESMDLIQREPHPNDRRKTLVSLTDSGNVYRSLRLSEFGKNICELFSKLSEKDLDDFSNSLNVIVSILKKV